MRWQFNLGDHVRLTAPGGRGAGMAGIHWVIRRRDKLAAESSSPDPANPEASSDDEVSS